MQRHEDDLSATDDGEAIVTPCVGICVVDQASGLCQGCLRSLAEIASWSRLSNAERRLVMAELPSRRLHGA